MASVLNRTTKQYILSAHTPDYPVIDWIINPDISAVVGVPTKYWVVTGDVVSEMSQAEKDAYDAAQPKRDFRFAEENGAQTTTSEVYQNAITLTPTNGLSQGVYRMSWTCEHRITASGPLNSRVQTRFRIDSTTKSNTASVSEQWEVHSGWDRYFATEDEKPVLTLDYRRDPGVGGNDTVEIRKVRVGMEYMGTN